MAVVLNSKVRLVRNVRDFNFPSRISNGDAKEIIEKVESIATPLGYSSIDLKNTTSIEKLKLFEDEIITGELLKNIEFASVFLKEDSPEILVNETDHIVIQKSRNELNLETSFYEIMKLDDAFDGKINYAFDDEFGYLASNPLNSGCAMIPSVMMHLPAISYYNLTDVFKKIRAKGYKIEGINKEKKKALGNIYIISPVRTIGFTEKDYINRLNVLCASIITKELEKRQEFYLENIIELKDIVSRSYGILSNARIIDEEEMMQHFSNIFLGLELNIIKANREIDFVETIKNFKNGHIQIERGSLLDSKSRNILRANNIRKLMKEVF
ncbi:ATP--guanido phosphotransferase [Peptoniphilus stercorisuis]|uniref:Protein arginine kinase n=1 Tax=Peptoniphilus stercorisuis TaxID=1436965 RepID=A0ABS4KD81_9FIRM|nr:ATP--guanido phosphotransferase [Peptoniphilus stercorisuis]MBP2025728.1 protein arginine kinase [Peptoniphilus stercorisuis]